MSTNELPPLSQLDPTQAWQPWRPTAQEPWDLKWAGHLYRRAGFGAPRTRLREAVGQGFEATLERILEGDPAGAQRDRELAHLGRELAKTNDPFDHLAPQGKGLSTAQQTSTAPLLGEDDSRTALLRAW